MQQLYSPTLAPKRCLPLWRWRLVREMKFFLHLSHVSSGGATGAMPRCACALLWLPTAAAAAAARFFSVLRDSAAAAAAAVASAKDSFCCRCVGFAQGLGFRVWV
jgi:hypothetical protein